MIAQFKKYLERRKKHTYNELWRMIYGFEEYPGGLLYRYEDAMERVESLKTTRDILNKRINKLEVDVAKLRGSKDDAN
jgi:hypothetical protein